MRGNDRFHIGVGGRWVHGFTLAVSQPDGVAIVGINYSGPLKCISIAEGVPSPGVQVMVKGFAKQQSRTTYPTIRSLNSQSDMWLDYIAINGESGGEVVSNGELVGIIDGYSTNSSFAWGARTIRSLFMAKYGEIPTCGKPKEPTVQPSPGIAVLLKRIGALESKVASLESRQPEKGDPGENGERGVAGPPGEPGSITVVLIDSNGNEISKAEGLNAGSVVRLKIDRFLKEK